MRQTSLRVLAGAAVFVATGLSTPAVLRAQPATPGQELVVQTGHQYQIEVVAFSADGRLIASGDFGGSIRIWEAATGIQLWALPGHSGILYALEFSRDGRWLASAGGAGRFGVGPTVKIWEVTAGTEARSFDAGGDVTALAISTDGNLVAAASRSVRIWNIASAQQIAEITADNRTTVAFSPRDNVLAILDRSGLRLWSPDEVRATSIRPGDFWPVEHEMTFLAGGATLAILHHGVVQTVDVLKGTVSERIAVGKATTLFHHPESSDQFIVGVMNRYEVWDRVRRRKVRDMPHQREDPDEVPSPSWRWMAIPNPKEPPYGAVRLKDLQGGRASLVLGSRAEVAGAVAFTPDGSLMATKAGRGFWVWDLNTGAPRKFVDHSNGDRGDIDTLSFTGNGRSLIVTDSMSNIAEWDIASGKLSNATGPTPGKDDYPHACSADGRWCVAGRPDRVDVFELETWRVYRTFKVDGLRGLAISDDGNWIAAANQPGDVWDRRNGRHREFKGHTASVIRVAFSPGGRLLVSADISGAVKVWEVESGRELKAFESGHTGVLSVAFSPDSRLLATGGSEATIRLWDADSGQLRHTLKGHADWIAKLAFSPNGRFLASGSLDGTTRIWDVEKGINIALLTTARDSEDWLVVTPDGFLDGSASATETLVAWRIGTSAYPLERYFTNFFKPGLLATLLRGGAPEPARPSLPPAPPVIRILDNGGRVLKEPRLSLKMRVDGPAAEVSLFHNGARVATQPGAPGETADYTFNLELIPGENELRAVAVSPADVWSNPDSIRITYDAPSPPKPTLYVLSIGVSRYQASNWNLGFARADAEALASFFKERNTKLFDAVNATVLADEHASRANIQNAITSVSEHAQPQDIVLIYFAGHGVAVEKTYYLLPHEMRDEVSLEADVKKFGLSDRALLDSLRKIRALKKIVILDACESASALDILSRSPAAERAALEMLARAEGLFIIAASTRQQEAIEIPQLGHGVLTYAILSGLGGTGDGTAPGVITMHQLLMYISQKVPELAARYGRTTRQVPVSFHRGMDFPLAVR